ncbi:enolase C-terminal domain-like protein [Amycolatopsis thermophila]|uniref:L-alanine-DL-glutamate epimerase-like enolase superfamily enzyme n=1 Tax=Amycolatopsis thermophila TaxID=206084 RepID=A0ABU0EZ36_9PSEU|nr:enolase C-terminal domain-like protein [Amycolatopsis thermophila]MDQ0380531.1 L-alanine-DL-glutamate epimerase-like enolase superfamily enzyme [Amycolatopsis thermophila]
MYPLAAYPGEPWVEHFEFEWPAPLFDEYLEISGGRMHLSARPGLGVTISEQAREWTVASGEVRA